MKRKFILPVVALLSLGLAACNSTPSAEEQKSEPATQQTSVVGGGSQAAPQSSKPAAQEKISVSAEGDKKNLILGENVQLTSSVEGVTWTSDHPEIATVSATGLVESKAVGSAKITASKEGYKDGSITIKIDLQKIAVTAADNKTTLVIGETVLLTADQQGVTWESDHPEIASVANGLVTAVAAGSAKITASKEGFNAGSVNITVTRPAANLKADFTTDADHYSADGWWELPSAGGFGFAMQTVNGWNPIAQQSSWGQEGSESDTFVGGFGEGDKETVKFNSDKAGKAEILVNLGNTTAITLSEIMDIKLNNVAIDISNISLEGHEGDYGMASLEFSSISLGQVDLVANENVLVFEMKAANNLFLNELEFYAGDATIALVPPAAKEQIAVKEAALEVIVDETVAIESDVTGLSYASVDETIATVSDAGVVTGVKVGKTNITVKKEGMYSVRVEITVNPKPVAGQIIIEAEDGEEVTSDWSGGGYMRSADGGYGASSEVHSGGAYISYFSMGGGDVDLTLTLKFNVETAQTMVLSVVGAAPTSWGSDPADYVFADSATITLNDNAVAVGEAKFTAPESSGGYVMVNPMEEIIVGDVAVVAGENTLVFHTVGSAPSLDCFKLSLKA